MAKVKSGTKSVRKEHKGRNSNSTTTEKKHKVAKSTRKEHKDKPKSPKKIEKAQIAAAARHSRSKTK